jgi:hypothetical protein
LCFNGIEPMAGYYMKFTPRPAHHELVEGCKSGYSRAV